MSREAAAFLGVVVWVGLAFGIGQVVYVPFLSAAGLPGPVIGRVLGLTAVAAVAAALPAGRALDRWGLRPVVLAAGVVGGAGQLAQLFWPRSPLLLYPSAACMGAAGGAFAVTAAPFLATAVPVEARARAFGLQSALSTLAGVAGAVLGGLLPEAFASLGGWSARELPPLRLTLLTAMAVAAAAGLPLAAVGGGRPSASVTTAPVLPVGGEVSEKPLPGGPRPRLLPWVLTGLGGGLLHSLFNLFLMDELGASPRQVGWVLGGQSTAAGLAVLALPRVESALGPRRAVLCSLAGSVPWLAALAGAPHLSAAVPLVWVRAAVASLGPPMALRCAMEVAPPHRRAWTSGLVQLSANLGWAAGAVLAGGIAGLWGHRAPLLAAVAAYVAAAAAFGRDRSLVRR
ncbi:MAG: MFS transporter [Clostridia bacterium]|nr:MFS transporter [Clostridia bacterium]